MAYTETKSEGLVTIELTCDARKGAGICGNVAAVTMQSRDAVLRFLGDCGWRLLRGHQVCASCLRKARVSFPRKAVGR